MKAGGSVTAGRRRRGGRRTKEAWRKNVDIGDVEQFLEEQRLDERLGHVSEKSDAELFTVDTMGDTDVPHSTDTPAHDEVLTSKQRRRAALAAVPRCYQVLLPTSQVQDPNKKRNTVRAVGSRPGALSRETTKRRTRRGTLAARESEREAGVERARRLRTERRTSRRRFQTDVWTDELESRRVEPSLRSEWLDAEAVAHHVPPSRRTPRPASGPVLQRDTPPALPLPHPGQSYNPSYEEHQALLAAVCEKEKQLIKKEKHLQRVTTNLFKHVRADKAQSEWLREMMSGLPEVPTLTPAPSAPDSDSSEGGEYSAVNPPVLNKKKDDKKRRKRREHEAMLQQQLQRKVDKKKVADLYKLRFLEAALEKAEARLSRLRELRAARRTARLAAAPPALNAHKHKPHDEDFLTPDQLAPALRAHAHTGHLLRDRFESLQRRGKLAPSRIFLRKKLRLKRYYKPGHKVSARDVAARTALHDSI